jgi:ligand-binding SRPBCC domain-containing protein
MEHTLNTVLELPFPREKVFEFFADAANLERITPDQLKFQVKKMSTPTIEAGTRISYRLKLMGIPFGWETLISTWEPPYRFVDTQLKGPYAKWVHTHGFEARGNSTLITDSVVYRLPLSPLGDLIHPFIRMQLNQIFAFRQKIVKDLLTAELSRIR